MRVRAKADLTSANDKSDLIAKHGYNAWPSYRSRRDCSYRRKPNRSEKRDGLDDLITLLPPPPNRLRKADGEHEHHFYEGAVMLAYAMHLLRTEPTKEVRICPDGEHAKQFEISAWLRRRGFSIISNIGKTSYGGIYTDAKGRTIVVHPKAGLSDVSADVGGLILSAECKGGIINTRHPGQISRL